MRQPTPAEVESYTAAGLPCEQLAVEGDGRHFYATIVSPEFEGLSRVRRHQRIQLGIAQHHRRAFASRNKLGCCGCSSPLGGR